MLRRKFYIHTIQVKKVEPTLPVDFKLPVDADKITGLFFNISKKFTGLTEVRKVGELSISLDNGISCVISSVEVRTNEHLYNNIINIKEPIEKNAFARILYKDLNNQAVDSTYEVKIYFLYEKKQSPCTPNK